MAFFVLVGLSVAVVLSIRFAANLVGAKSSVGMILLCLLVQSALSEISRRFVVDNAFVQFVAAFAGGALVYSLLLDTSFAKGLVISVVSSALILACLVLLAAKYGLGSVQDGGQAPLAEMEQRAAADVARNRDYNLAANAVLMGDGHEMRRCLPGNQPQDFEMYLEILPDGSLGKTRLEPMTRVGACFLEVAHRREFPKPPGAYVIKSTQKFKRGG